MSKTESALAVAERRHISRPDESEPEKTERIRLPIPANARSSLLHEPAPGF